jgi:hypothetical protein
MTRTCALAGGHHPRCLRVRDPIRSARRRPVRGTVHGRHGLGVTGRRLGDPEADAQAATDRTSAPQRLPDGRDLRPQSHLPWPPRAREASHRGLRARFSFSVTRAGWENLEQAGGAFDLTSITAPGDVILFAGRPRATKPDGAPASGVESSVASLGAWLAVNPALTATAGKPVTIGGLKGQAWDITASPSAEGHLGDCLAQVCVQFLRGRDPSSKPTGRGTSPSRAPSASGCTCSTGRTTSSRFWSTRWTARRSTR